MCRFHKSTIFIQVRIFLEQKYIDNVSKNQFHCQFHYICISFCVGSAVAVLHRSWETSGVLPRGSGSDISKFVVSHRVRLLTHCKVSTNRASRTEHVISIYGIICR